MTSLKQQEKKSTYLAADPQRSFNWRRSVKHSARMKKVVILLIASLLFVSCATTKHATTENSKIFKAYNLQANRIEIIENQELRDLFNEFNTLYFQDELQVDYIGYVDNFLLHGKGNSYYYVGYSFWELSTNGYKYGIAMSKKSDLIGESATNNYFNGVLLHEMVHLYFYQNGMFSEGHGKNFRKMIDALHEMNPQYEKVYD